MAREMKDSGIAWIGEIPVDWEVKRNKALFYEVNDRCEHGDQYTLLSVSEYSGITPRSEIIDEGEFETHAASLDGYKICQVGDIVMNIMLAWKRATAASAYDGIVSPAYCVYRGKGVNTKYFHYLFRTDGCSDMFKRFSTGIIDSRLRLYPNVFLALYSIVPPLHAQNQITDYLDAECARIDAVIEQTRASIEEYKKLKQAVITQAVTKGIRPNRPMKDSGIDWVGEIPEEWEVRRIKTIFRLRDERNYLPLEEVNLISLYTDKGVVQHCDLEQTTGNKASNADGYKKVYQNDIIVNIILCWMGAIGRSDYDGVTSPAYDIYIPSDDIECRFYHHYFRTKGFSGDCYKRGRGIMAMRWRTYSDQFRDISVVVPPIQEQREILVYLDGKTAEIDQLIAKKTVFLSELESYRKSLIFDYVTGKKGGV